MIPRPQGISIGDFDGKDVVRSNDYTSSKSNEDDNENLRAGDSEINEVYNFTVVGIGAVSDYNSPLKNLSDASVDSNSFGLLFVTESAYDELNESKTAMKYFSMPNMHPEVSPFMIAYALIFPPVLSAIVNALVIRSRLNRTPLSLLKNEQKVSKSKDVKLKEMEFIKLFKIRQLLRERRTGFTVVFGLFMSLLVAMLAVNVYVYCDKVNVRNVEDTHFEYMYTYKYPSEKVPEGGYEAVAENMKKRFGEYNFDVTILGINEDNPFFDIEKLPKSKNEVVVSDSFAYKYQLKKGEEFTLTSEDGDRAYAFTVPDNQ